jgi:DNA repair photolyase
VDIFRTTPPKTVCPNFYVLAHADGCTFSPQCTYCYLKSSFWYLGKPRAFKNLKRMVAEVERWIAKDNLESYVLNMGNLSDSLAFEADRPLIATLVETFRTQAEGRPHTLLLVTKGGRKECRSLFDVPPCDNVVVSFSVNHPEAARNYEKGAATVEDRFEAASELKRRGWRLRLRIDPMIHGYDYAATVNAVRRLRPERVTLGTLRAERSLPKYVENGMFNGLVRPEDPKGVARYPMDVRLALYRPAVVRLKDTCTVALCEEVAEVWDALGLDKDAKACNCGR